MNGPVKPVVHCVHRPRRTKLMGMGSREERAWAAGFFDGEGHVGFRTRETMRARSSTVTRSINLSLTQVDRELLDRFAVAVGVGKVRGPYEQKNPNGRPFFMFATAKRDEIVMIAERLRPWLGSAKLAQLDRALAEWNAFAPSGSICEHGISRYHCSECRSRYVTRKITAEQTKEIARRVRDGERQSDLASEFGVSRARVCQIAKEMR